MSKLGTTSKLNVILLHSYVETIVDLKATFIFWFKKQELGVPPQEEYAYIAHEEEHPSPSRVFPSSHA